MEKEITKEQFCERFIAHMVKIVGPREDFDVKAHAEENAPTYFAEQWQERDEFDTPESLAEVDVSYWET